MKDLTTYLNFDGNCGEAMTFYAKCMGMDVEIMDFSQAPGGAAGNAHDRVMHARIPKGPNPILMASDTMPGMPFTPGTNFSISIQCESMEEIQRLFAAFGEGGKVTMPLQDQFWGAHFGMLKDRFGINWMFNYDLPKPA
jgi:PhnB protein